jgi:hypothetical protein
MREKSMRKGVKIGLLMLLFLLVLFSFIGEWRGLSGFRGLVDLTVYTRIVSVLGLTLVVLLVWHHKRQMEISQKYRRADQILVEAAAAAKQKEGALKQFEAQASAILAQKEQELSTRLSLIQSEHQRQLLALKEQNVALKETVGKLMQALKGSKMDAQP